MRGQIHEGFFLFDEDETNKNLKSGKIIRPEDNYIFGNYTGSDFDVEEKADFIYIEPEKVEVLRKKDFEEYKATFD